jgi:uncharacterized protein (TIGR01619 family)
MRRFPSYQFDSGEKADPNWDQYHNVLFPPPEELQKIANRDVLDVLRGHGDVHSNLRKVEHWVYFASESARASFKNEVVSRLAYQVTSETTVEGERPFGISLTRVQAVEQDAIDQAVIELLHMAQRFGGEYDGWETEVMPSIN